MIYTSRAIVLGMIGYGWHTFLGLALGPYSVGQISTYLSTKMAPGYQPRT